MSLTEYKKKRSFKHTPEPEGGEGTGKELRFVIQKHDATHLHYDFRLEMEGVLKSWAIPKGPSTDPEIKRLAMMVEDHPYDYRNFEGIIPEEEYGGGTVIVWDEGTYTPFEPESDVFQKQEKQLLDQLKAGKLKIILKGKKLKGAYALVKAYGRGDNGWLLMKLKDKYAADSDILLKDKSVVSGKTIAQMEKQGKTITPVRNRLKELLKKTVKKAFYDEVKPMLATLVSEPFDEPGWVYEIKWDGYRAVAFMNKGKVAFKSRNDQSYNQKYYPIYEKLKELKINAIIDGEVVVVNKNGNANFGALQNWNNEADGELLYYVFDILWYNGYDLSHLPLLDRKAILAELIPNQFPILLSKVFETSGIDFLNATKRAGLEGIMAKRANSTYQIGNRTNDWLKIKASNGQEVVIGGFTKIAGSPKPFSSLLVGLFKKGKFIYTGKIGTGFSVNTQKELLAQFEPLIISKSPFYEEPDVNKPNRFRFNSPQAKAIWLKPELICEVSFSEMTTDGLMRHPSFKGMREDKKAKEVMLETPDETDEIVPKPINLKDMLVKKDEETQVKKVNGQELTFTNPDKIYWPVEKISKGDLINYYDQISPFILPYLKDRPQSLSRYPNGITGQNFYQKDVTGKVPDWIKTYLYHAEGDDTDKHFLVGKDKATLLYMANLGCIEIHPWSSTIKKPDHPTWCILDLDPDKQPFDQTIEVAQVTKAILDDMGVPGYCKTSGSTGLHIYIPLGNKYTYDQSKEFAKIIVTLVNRELPKTTSIERVVADRKGKIYLDFLQNRTQATIAAPYSLRPKPGATVSMPLHWDEVKKGLQMKDFDIYNAFSRASEMGDLFKPVLGKGIDLAAVIKRNR
ncbi:bifunctional non-homologous end joining protein LigD [Pedobacter steynii]|uniref:DNA ligase (ATP) n=1 Tax=Pedobacter steynii TaxID=430522 RepID=A0A1G9NBJ0_9SPHI|nr:DNA ligase D [Pedobacter steynii]NQX39353.1 DNA ligase D [Pedobacter steynii]SDL83830.1 bifunctional non-homologous end joining protein LigD [Pedobacter steynii]